MTELTYLFAGLALLTGVITSISIWAPRRLWLKCSALGAAALFLVAAYASLAQLLSLPKPVGMEWLRANATEATVLGASIRENQAIYVWLQLADTPEPRAYALPWNRDLAEQLQAAQRESEQSGSQVQMRLPFEASLDDQEPKFYAMPQPQPPSKDLDQPPAMFYQRPAGHDA
ncbi:MAG: hypothetical protein ACREH6_09285 [Geminicoccaceae bacterium]